MKISFALLLSLLALSASGADLTEAKRLVDAKRVPEALPLLEKALETEPENVDLLLLLGRCQTETQQETKALATLEKAFKLAPERADVLSPYGLACLGEASRQKSISLARKGRDALDKAIALQPDNILARRTLFAYYLNAPWIAGGSTDKAREQAEAINRFDPNQGLMLLVALKNKDKKFDDAFALCTEALKRDPESYFALYELGRTAALSGARLDEGLAALRKCLEKPAPADGAPRSMVLFRLGMILVAKGDKAGARLQYEEGLKLDPSNKQIAKALSTLSAP